MSGFTEKDLEWFLAFGLDSLERAIMSDSPRPEPIPSMIRLAIAWIKW